jgi:hypothetical protein
MTAEHKAALAEGRAQSRAVRTYLDALEAHKPKRGRKRTPESIAKRLAKIDQDLEAAESLKRLQLIQERLDLLAEKENMENKPDFDALKVGFVTNAKGYAERKGISYAAWRELGIEPAVLQEAGISRGS